MTKTGRNDPCPCNSGEKYKRCCLNNPFISDRFTANLFQRIQTLANRIHDSSEAATDALEKRARSMIPGSDHREEVCAQILQYLDWLESQVRPLIARHSSIFWLCLDSRFPPGFDQQGDDLRRSAMSQMFNITKTLLFHKFGNTNIEPFTVQEDGTFDFLVQDEDITCLFGALRAFFHELAFLPNEYRRAGKGAAPCTERGIGLVTKMTPALEELARLYDERRSYGNGGFLSTGGLGSFRGRMLSPLSRSDSDESSTVAAIPVPGDHPHTIEGMGRVKSPGFTLFELSLDRMDNLRPFESRFEEILGLSLDQLRGCYVAIQKYILEAWRPAAEYTLVSRGIWFSDENTLRSNLIRRYAESYKGQSTNDLDAQKVVDRFILMLEGSPTTCDLLLRQNQRSLTRHPRVCALDLSITHVSLLDFLTDLTIDDEMKQIKGNHFEDYVTRSLKDAVPSVKYPIKPGLRLKRMGEKDPFAQADTYAQVEDVLFLVESKAYSVTRDYLKGAPQAVSARWELIQSWLRKSDARAEKIIQTRTGSNFSITADVKFIVPVICSAFSEFVWSDTEEFFLRDKKIPRVCTLEELIVVMTGSLDSVRSSSVAISVL